MDIVRTINAKVTAGTLRCDVPLETWADYGSGRSCDGCGQAIARTAFEHEWDFEDGCTLRFHSGCAAVLHDECGRQGRQAQWRP